VHIYHLVGAPWTVCAIGYDGHQGDRARPHYRQVAKLAAEKPDARGVEQLPRSLAHLEREISEK
jgi:hypothetical protein